MPAAGSARTGRRPGSTDTRASILAAARELFSEHGYRGATLRAIAARAGVDPALIRHFYTDKDGLFAATLAPQVEAVGQVIIRALDGPPEGAGERLTRGYLGLWESPDTAGPLLAVVRSSIADERALGILRRSMTPAILAGPTPAAVPDHPELRIPLSISHLLGAAVARHVVKVPPLCDLDVDQLTRLLAPAVQQHLTGALDL